MNQLPTNPGQENQGAAEYQQAHETDRLADTPRIWVGSLSDYNNGVLHGEWIDATQDDEDVYQQIGEMLAASPATEEYRDLAEEYGIFDYDNFCGLRIGEYDHIAVVTQLARLIEEHGEAFVTWTEHVGRDVATSDDAGEKFLNSYMGCYRSKEDYVEVLLDDLGVTAELDEAVSPILRGYVSIDYSMLAQDLELSGDVTFVEGRDGWWAFTE